MDFSLSEEQTMLKEVALRFTTNELMPLEKVLLEREMRMWTDGYTLLPAADHERLMKITREMGFWGIEVDEKLGGQGLGMFAKTLVVEEMSKSLVGFSHHGFTLPPDAPNLYYLEECGSPAQREKYVRRYCRGEIDSAMMATEPGAGSDISGLTTTAVRENGQWVINGSKIFISKCDKDELFFICLAVTDKAAPTKRRFTAFILDKDTPGLRIGAEIPVIGAMPSWTVYLDNVRVGDDAVLGEVGDAFIPLQNRFGVRRIELAAHCTGMAERLIQMMIDQANLRKTFGEPLAERQTVQNWIADSTVELEQVRLQLYFTAWKSDQGHKDLRIEASSLKIAATEMLTRIADRAIQLYGGLGLSRELGIEYVARMVRIWRIVEGASEVHRISIAKKLLADGKTYSPFVAG
ncbi:acyl-CoA dehydrogenase family protein [Aromatoleum buckelii]|uniref:Acyl-CoA dehydrogenase n=1 Tax=Aromatoleum buckelii TaxID=200254 RepID=A0ABX1N3V8_9RHOO|nr:acyl-CoA dehydrogenase [Aromatoleum buckelii]MCK0511488.1 acyl-CoA dehydrogenase [Aromatoleum buckelii]